MSTLYYPNFSNEHAMILAMKRAFLASSPVSSFAEMIQGNEPWRWDLLSAKDRELPCVIAFRNTIETLACAAEAYLKAGGFVRMNPESAYFQQLVFDEVCKIVHLVGRAVEEFKSVSILSDSMPRLDASQLDKFARHEVELNRLFPIVDHQTTYTIRFAASGRFLNGDWYSMVVCSDDFVRDSCRFGFVPDTSSELNTVGDRRVVSFGEKSTFGLQRQSPRGQSKMFVGHQTTCISYDIPTEAGLANEDELSDSTEWTAVSVFRSAEYSRPLRVGDLFFLRTADQLSYLSNSDPNHLVLRSCPNESCYLMVLDEAQGRFLYEG